MIRLLPVEWKTTALSRDLTILDHQPVFLFFLRQLSKLTCQPSCLEASAVESVDVLENDGSPHHSSHEPHCFFLPVHHVSKISKAPSLPRYAPVTKKKLIVCVCAASCGNCAQKEKNELKIKKQMKKQDYIRRSMQFRKRPLWRRQARCSATLSRFILTWLCSREVSISGHAMATGWGADHAPSRGLMTVWGLECVGFTNLDIRAEDDGAAKEEDDS